MPIQPLEIPGRKIGPGQPCFVVAEVGVNHNGSEELACRMVDLAAEAGADAVKFQTFRADRLASSEAPKAPYQMANGPSGELQLGMLRRLELPEDAHRRLQSRCRERGVLFLSTPFEEDSADFLDGLGVPLFKMASGEITNLPFLAHVARKGKPMIVSTGMSTLEEVGAAIGTIRAEGNEKTALLHCVSRYPADPAEANLRAMATLEKTFSVPIGFSDHTLGIEVALAAVALGACIIEKHLTLDRKMPGPDHQASLEPGELRDLVQKVRIVESALGDGSKRPVPAETATAAVARKSLVAARDIAEGTVLIRELVDIRRPGTGLSPGQMSDILGKRALRSLPKGTLLRQEDFQRPG
jgi:N,N'-diacetyllegionaminate synthase